jgi:hypothetical protein
MAEPLAPSEQVLHVRQSCDDPETDEQWNLWTTTEAITIEADEWLTVPAGFPTDLVSVPNAFSWFVPRAGRYARAAVLHDHLWKLADNKQYNRRNADRQFRFALRNAEVPLLRRWIMWAAVRLGSIVIKRDAGNGTWKDLPGIIALALIALPFVGPPALVILPATYAFGLLEKAIHYVTPKKGEQQETPAVQLWT